MWCQRPLFLNCIPFYFISTTIINNPIISSSSFLGAHLFCFLINFLLVLRCSLQFDLVFSFKGRFVHKKGLARTGGFLPQRPIVSWLCARTVKETTRSDIFLTILCSQYVRYTSMDFVESLAVCALLLRTRAKRRKRFWVHPLVNQRLLKGQFHKLCEDLCIHPKNFLGILE